MWQCQLLIVNPVIVFTYPFCCSVIVLTPSSYFLGMYVLLIFSNSFSLYLLIVRIIFRYGQPAPCSWCVL